MGFINKRPIASIIIFYAIIVLIKILLAFFIKTPVEFADGYLYAKIARDIYQFDSGSLAAIAQLGYPPFYPALLAPAYAFGNMPAVYFTMKIINALISALIVFPVFFLAMEFLNSRKSMFITGLIALSASNFNISNYIMAENLFYPLSIFSIYFIYKSFKENKVTYYIISGILVSLAIMTKVIGFALIPVVFLAYLFFKKRLYLKAKNIFLHYFAMVVILIPFIVNIVIKLSNKTAEESTSSIYYILLNGLIKNSLPSKILGYLNWSLFHLSYLFLATGVLFSVYFIIGLIKKKEIGFEEENLKLLYFLTIILTVITIFGIITAFYGFAAGASNVRIVGRYFANLLPLIFLLGYISFEKTEFNQKKIRILLIVVCLVLLVSLFATNFLYSQLFPLNNQDVAYIGLVKYVITNFLHLSLNYSLLAYSSVFLILISLFYFRDNKKHLIYLAVLIILLNSIIAYSITYYNSSQWSKSEQYELAIWMNKYDPQTSKILIEESSNGRINRELQSLNEKTRKSGFISYIGFWLNDELYFEKSTEKMDYRITKEKLDKELLYETSGKLKIKVYRA